MKYAFFNRGTITFFDPKHKARTADGRTISKLELHMEMVQESERLDVYITDHKGRDVSVEAMAA